MSQNDRPDDALRKKRRQYVLRRMSYRLKRVDEVVDTIVENWGMAPPQLCQVLKDQGLLAKSTYWADVRVLRMLANHIREKGAWP